MNLPLKALSIRQPWAHLICNGHKDIENRDWRTNYRGPVLIHAGLKVDRAAEAEVRSHYHPVTGEEFVYERPSPDGGVVVGMPYPLQVGGIVGMAEIVDCVEHSESDWFVGQYGFVLRNARPLPFMRMNGMLGFFLADRYAAEMWDRL